MATCKSLSVWEDTELVDFRGLPPGMAPGRRQAHRPVGLRPKAQPVKPTVGRLRFCQPDKAHGLVLKAPRPDKPQGLRELRKRGPQKKNTKKPPVLLQAVFIIRFSSSSRCREKDAVIRPFHLTAHHRTEYAYNRGGHTKHGFSL